MSLISTYQSRKSLFAEKLITKGVEASATDGLTTLINKIDDIPSEGFTDGLLLYADKKIAQSEDTVNLYALLLEDNVAVSGEKVKIYSDIYLRSETCSSTDSLYDDYYASSSKSGLAQYDFIGENSVGSPYIRYNSTTINIFYGGQQWSSDFRYTGEFHIKEGVLTYKDSEGVSHTVDVSMVDTTKVPTNPITVHYKWVEVTTDSDGVASYEYDCTGSGLREFYATSGTFVSETFVVTDCIKYDGGTSNTSHLSIWNTTGATPQVTPDYTSLIYDNAVIWHTCEFNAGSDFILEFDVNITTTNRGAYDITIRNANQDLLNYYVYSDASLQSDNWYHIICRVENNMCTISNDVTPYVRSRDITGYSKFVFNCRQDETVRYKNFKIYPI